MKRTLLSTCIACSILAYGFAGVQRPPSSGEEQQIYIVILREPSVARKVTEQLPDQPIEARRRLLTGREADAYRIGLERSQEMLRRELALSAAQLAGGGPGETVEVLDSQADLLNALVVRATPEQAVRLSQRKEVAGVYPNLERRLLTDTLPSYLGATTFWSSHGGSDQAGVGTRIGIIDSGINISHPMFQDGSLTPPAGFPPSSSFAGYTNSKVIVARNYVETRFGLEDQPDKTPRDERGHGSNVAAIAAGATAESPLGTVQGIAPRAFLGNYKVFGQPGVNDITTSAAIIAALNDALLDGMDVVNLSLGGTPRSPDSDPEQQAIKQLANLGVMVVVAAGNSGPGAGTVTSPGTSPDAVSVGATSHSRVFRSKLTVESPSGVPPALQTIEYVPGTGSSITSVLGPWEVVSIAQLDPGELACDPFPGNLAGKVALVKRGECFFSVKASHVLDGAGAAGMVVYNNVQDPPVIMDFGDHPPAKPAVMITLAEGLQLRDFISGQPSQIVFHPEEPFPRQPDILAGFSGRGPSIIQEIKPDLSAPGQDIYTASNLNGNYRRGANGTSFSTPAVAGAAALVRQQHPNWPSRHIKSVLVNTARRTVTENGAPARVNDAGNGRLDLASVLSARGVVWPVSVSFGVITDGIAAPLQRTLTLTNIYSSPQTFSFGNFPSQALQGIDVRVSPTSVRLNPGESRALQVELSLPPDPEPGTLEGYLRIRVQEGGGTDLTVSYWGALAIQDNSRILLVSREPGTGNFPDIQAALSEALPGDIIEITDSSTYQAGVVIDTNVDGIPLHRITLRATPGQTPVIFASEEDAGVGVYGLQGVTLEGLTILGGRTGILYQDSSGVIRENRLESTLESAVARISLQSSQAHILDNHVLTFLGSGLTLFDSPALIQHNTFGENSGIGTHGIFAGPTSSSSFAPISQRAVGIFNNRLHGAGQAAIGQGIRITSAPALLKGNTITNSPGHTSDGILGTGQDTSLWIVNNLIRNHDRIGVWINNGAQAELSGNTIQRNGLTGLQADNSRATVAYSQILENGTGISAVSSQLSLKNSLVAASALSGQPGGNGISSTNSQVTVINSTVSANEGTGVQLTSSNATIANSIFSLNSGGDLVGHQGQGISFNLFESHPLVGSSGNLTGDPLFSDPSRLDFSLRPGSAAIDRGSIDFVDSGYDLLSHHRVTDGDQDSLADVDLGAIEYGSPHSPPLVLPVLSNRNGEFVGLALANVLSLPEDPVPAAATPSTEVTLRLIDSSGTLVDEHREEIPAGSQISVLLDEIFPALPEGWVEILPANREIMSFTLLGNGSLSFLDGAQLSDKPAQKLLFPEVRNDGTDSTILYLVNPRIQSTQVRIDWIGESGSVLLTAQKTLSPRSMLSGSLKQIFDTTPCSVLDCTSGYIVVEAGHPVSGLEIFGNEDHIGGLLALDYEDGNPDVFAAQMASTQDLETILNVINTRDAATLTVTARNDAGAVIGKQVTTQIPAGGQWRFSAREAFQFSEDQVGWVEIHCPFGAVQGNIVFGDPAGRFLTALPLQARGAREFVLSHVAQTTQIFTGVTLLNPGPGPALFSLEVFDRSGNQTGLALSELKSGQKRARLLPQILPGLTEQAEGFIRVRSNQPLLGFQIFGGYSLEFFSAVPQQVIVY